MTHNKSDGKNSHDKNSHEQNSVQEGGGRVEDLTPRQQQILRLMQAGKVNKDIARELDISIGTVKQHLVSIFKKLNVKNRTMAVARLAEFKDQSGFDQVFHGETLMAMRPSIVLSLKVNPAFPRAVQKFFHTSLSEKAFDCNALFISSEAGYGDLVFGLKRSSAQDMRMATLVATHINSQIASMAQQDAAYTGEPVLKGALVAGLITVSQNRFGGWSGEAVGSHVMQRAHELRDLAAEGSLMLDQPVKAVMQAFDLTLPGGIPEQILFQDLIQLNGWNSPDNAPLAGRDQELEAIDNLIANHLRVLVLEGENGMGKSRLCREAARRALALELPLYYIRVLPTGYLDSVSYRYFESWFQVQSFISEACAEKAAALLIIDDAHHFTAEDRAEVAGFLNHPLPELRVLISGRQPQVFALSCSVELQAMRLHLNRLEASDLTAFFTGTQGHPDAMERCRGVPLFARELALESDESRISLAMMITVASRIDKFKVDWKLLYCVAAHEDAISIARLSHMMQDDYAYIEAALERAENLGILSVTDKRASFKHPLVKDVVHYLFQSNPSSNAVSRYP